MVAGSAGWSSHQQGCLMAMWVAHEVSHIWQITFDCMNGKKVFTHYCIYSSMVKHPDFSWAVVAGEMLQVPTGSCFGQSCHLSGTAVVEALKMWRSGAMKVQKSPAHGGELPVWWPCRKGHDMAGGTLSGK